MEKSTQQEDIFNTVKAGHNIISNACAGAGKSTTVIQLAHQIPHKSIILITYNSSLCKELKERAKNVPNLTIYTYHSLARHFYYPNDYTDQMIIKITTWQLTPIIPLPQTDILVFDEVQDMTFLYYKLAKKFMRDLPTTPQLLFLGETRQCLYDFKGADSRFLTHAAHIWNHPQPFQHCPLSTSYRITIPMANFINDGLMQGNKCISAIKSGPPVKYYRVSGNRASEIIANTIYDYVTRQKYNPEDIFVLAASIHLYHVRNVENALVKYNIPCYYPSGEARDDTTSAGKVCFSTFHSVKGRQRPVVFLLGADSNYFKYNAKNKPTNKCPNTIYVAASRAENELHVFQLLDKYGQVTPFEFCNISLLPPETCEVIEEPIPIIKPPPEIQHLNDIRTINVTELYSFLPTNLIEYFSEIIETAFIKIDDGTATKIEITNIITTEDDRKEDVSDINGIAIPAYFQLSLLQNNTTMMPKLFEWMQSQYKQLTHSRWKYSTELANEMMTFDYTDCRMSNFLYSANIFSSIQNKTLHKVKQIPQSSYNWIDPQTRKTIIKRMKNVLYDVTDKTFAEPLISISHERVTELTSIQEKIVLNGRFDFLTEQNVWEIKCTSQTSLEHFLQIMVYAWIWRATQEHPSYPHSFRDFRLFNVLTGDVFILSCNFIILTDVVTKLIYRKINDSSINMSDDEFITHAYKL